MLSLQLFFQLLNKSPVCALREEPIGTLLDHPYIVQTQGVETHSVLGVVFTPLAIRKLLHGLERIIVARRVALIDEKPGRVLGLKRAYVGTLHDSSNSALGSHGAPADEIAVR